MPVYALRLSLPADFPDEDLGALGQVWAEEALSYGARRQDNDHQNPWVLEWFFDNPPPAANDVLARLLVGAEMGGVEAVLNLSQISVEELPDVNWLEQVYQEFQPFSVGPFFIHGSHYEGSVPDGQIGLLIDAVTAFGSGDHGTTKGCLQAMLDLKGTGFCPWNVLDMGTGSGILAIGAYKLWQTPITAVDIEDESIRVARKYRELNGIPKGARGGIFVHVGDGFADDLVGERGPYDLIIANILAGPLVEMAKDAVSVLDEQGRIILSGMLVEQADTVAAAYTALGLELKNRIDIGKWSTLVLKQV
ncbi:MAG: 50S ribosomal protein L11 methyltransferase [Alphaproteobacteria bacterium]|nr:50S ribosomal protein L11 methyltransferase [Alphaproteobacteria bacterium]